jgi:mediator of RNA polymerase II transcription subunit 12
MLLGDLELDDLSPQNLTAQDQAADGDGFGPLPMPPRRPQPPLRGPYARPPPPSTNALLKRGVRSDLRSRIYTIEIPAAAPHYTTQAKMALGGAARGRANQAKTAQAKTAQAKAAQVKAAQSKATLAKAAQAKAKAVQVKNSTGLSSLSKDAPGTKQAYADFFPWTGIHIEDQFSENVIRHGYFDKNTTSQPDTTSARSTLTSVLKHKGSFAALSAVFAHVMAERRQNGIIPLKSTFKPPPRVTLTDTKREMWLRDLANPAVFLRKLSRTIPHGVRGKILLEQCLNKKIPNDRAIWLAKCVGANEIRAFKRKGVNGTFVMGGEAKWIKDWTICIEQFLENVASAFTDKDWRSRVDYA